MRVNITHHLNTPERHFRHIAFLIAYHNIYTNVQDPLVRFGKALVYSIQPIRDYRMMKAFISWLGGHVGGTNAKTLLDEGIEPPAILRPMIDSYRRAMKRIEAFENDQRDDVQQTTHRKRMERCRRVGLANNRVNG